MDFFITATYSAGSMWSCITYAGIQSTVLSGMPCMGLARSLRSQRPDTRDMMGSIMLFIAGTTTISVTLVLGAACSPTVPRAVQT